MVLMHNTPVPKGTMQVLIGKNSFDSLLAAAFKEEGKVSLGRQPILIQVEDLENMAEGFATAFHEDNEVKISGQIDRLEATSFDYDFGNIPIKALITIKFSNPIDERFLSA